MLCISVCVKAAGCSREERERRGEGRGGEKKRERQDTKGKKGEEARTDGRTGGGRASGRGTGRGSSGRVEDLISVWQRQRGDSRQEEEKERKREKKSTMDRGHPQNQMASV